jgi:hypothetical protein
MILNPSEQQVLRYAQDDSRKAKATADFLRE